MGQIGVKMKYLRVFQVYRYYLSTKIIFCISTVFLNSLGPRAENTGSLGVVYKYYGLTAISVQQPRTAGSFDNFTRALMQRYASQRARVPKDRWIPIERSKLNLAFGEPVRNQVHRICDQGPRFNARGI
jgi:hypothetical protein